VTVLLLAGWLCPAACFDALHDEPALAGVPLVAEALPGMAGSPPLPHGAAPSVEAYAAWAAERAAAVGASVLVGHSLGANVALEVAATGAFRGPVVLLAPSLSREDEPAPLRALGRVGGRAAFALMLRGLPIALRGEVPRSVVAAMQRTDPALARQALQCSLEHLDRRGSLAGGVPGDAWVVLGGRDDVGVTRAERAALVAAPGVRLVDLPGVGHFAAGEAPATVATIVADALAAAAATMPA
jgi:pimeloyl-ACP methyl ester carboxylesterase